VRNLLIVFSAGAIALACTAVAAAQTVLHLNISGDAAFVDDSSCDFPIEVSFQFRASITDFFDADGTFVKAIVQQHIVGTASANGEALSEVDSYVTHYDAQGGQRLTGLPVHIALSGGGVVIRDAGNLQFDAEGNVVFVRGPHPLLGGDTAALCATLS
jgi:hypothetical protein